MDYIGKICPYCKTEFKHYDEIVVCSNCDMPHHKDCWVENQGCTTFGCSGTIKVADDAATSVTSTQINYDDTNPVTPEVVYCTKCGAKHDSTSSFCTKCGNKLITANSQPQIQTQVNPIPVQPYSYDSQSNNYSSGGYNGYQVNQPDIDPDVQQLIGAKADYYIQKFRELKSENKKNSWNWSAFLFTPYWLIYRKMYGYGAALLGAMFLFYLIAPALYLLLSLGSSITIGILANYMYMDFLQKKANNMKFLNEPVKSQCIAKAAGVNIAAAILADVGYSILINIVGGI